MMQFFRFVVFLVILSDSVIASATAGEELKILVQIAEIRALSIADARMALPVTVRGVVTLLDMFSASPQWLVLDDGMQSIWVEVSIAKAAGIWKGDDTRLAGIVIGDELELEGVSHPGGYAPIIVLKRFKHLGSKPLPEARKVATERLLSGEEDCQRIELRGVIQNVRVPHAGSDRISLALQAQGQTFQVLVEQWSEIDTARLIDAEVRVRGVFSPISNFRAEMVALRIRITGPNDIEVLKAPNENPFENVSRVTLDRLQPFSPLGNHAHRCVTQGIVTFSSPGDFFFVQEGGVGVKIEAPDAVVTVGERVEIAGFVDMSRMVASMTGAIVRSLGRETVPDAVFTTAEKLFQPRKVIEWSRVVESDFDGRLVRLHGHLRRIDTAFAKNALQLQMDMGSVNTTARLIGLNSTEETVVNSWAEGSELELTGVCETVFVSSDIPSMPKVASFDIWLRSPEDVRVLQKPSWWSSQHLTMALLASLFAFLIVFIWGFTLRRSLRLRAARLENVMSHHRDAELEFHSAQQERHRLAVNLHDGLQQMIAGAAFRLEAAEAQLGDISPAAQEQLTAARHAIVGTQTGLRDCLWGLRQMAGELDDFAALLRHAAGTMDHWPPEAVLVESTGETFALSRDVMGSLLLLMQEAVGNAFRHGRATRVCLFLHYSITGFEMRIKDDGQGFALSSVPDIRLGHFGLEGMRQRMRWLGGSVEITSEMGIGTQVCIRLSRSQASG
jgi:signal transduction histidine kinase